jgi:hypothetical protein
VCNQVLLQLHLLNIWNLVFIPIALLVVELNLFHEIRVVSHDIHSFRLLDAIEVLLLKILRNGYLIQRLYGETVGVNILELALQVLVLEDLSVGHTIETSEEGIRCNGRNHKPLLFARNEVSFVLVTKCWPWIRDQLGLRIGSRLVLVGKLRNTLQMLRGRQFNVDWKLFLRSWRWRFDHLPMRRLKRWDFIRYYFDRFVWCSKRDRI